MTSAITSIGERPHTPQLCAGNYAPTGAPPSLELTAADRTEILAFLAQRPAHTVFIAGLVHDNGVVSPLNPGLFYGYRNQAGALEGVALIGVKTVIEARTETALAALAPHTLTITKPYLIRGEQQQMEWLLAYAQRNGRAPRLVCQELLLEQTALVAGVEPVAGLRPATQADLEQVVAINAALAHDESGIDPLKQAPQRITQRTARRIAQERVWVLVEDGQIVFKTDVISDTPEAMFLEGVYVRPEERGRGYGLRCLTQLGSYLLARTSAICLVVNHVNARAQSLYYKAGYRLHSPYRTAYF